MTESILDIVEQSLLNIATRYKEFSSSPNVLEADLKGFDEQLNDIMDRYNKLKGLQSTYTAEELTIKLNEFKNLYDDMVLKINNGFFNGQNGKDGKDGIDGVDGQNGLDGKDGASFTFDMLTPVQLELIASLVTVDLTAILKRISDLENVVSTLGGSGTLPLAPYINANPFVNTREDLVIDTGANSVVTNFKLGLYSTELLNLDLKKFVTNIFATQYTYEHSDYNYLTYNITISDGRTVLPDGNYVMAMGTVQIDATGALFDSRYGFIEFYKNGEVISNLTNDECIANSVLPLVAPHLSNGQIFFDVRPPVDILDYLLSIGLDFKDLFYSIDINIESRNVSDMNAYTPFVTGGPDNISLSSISEFGGF